MQGLILQICLVALSVFVNIFILFNFCERMYQRLYKSRLLYIVLFLSSWILITGINLCGLQAANPAVYILLLLSLGVWGYGASEGSDILNMLLLLLFLISVEILSQLIIALLYVTPFTIPTGNIAQMLITFFSYQIVMWIIERKKTAVRVPGHWVTLIIVPGISFYLIFAILNLLTPDSAYSQVTMAATACILIFAINIFVYFLFSRIAALNQKNEQNKMMEQQRQLQYRYYNELEQKYDASRKLYHDVKNHLNALERMYEQQVPDTQSYTRTLRERMDAFDMPLTNSRVLNVLFADRTALAAGHGIPFVINCEDLDFSFITEFDLTTIMANLLDNAFDECENNGLKQNRVDVTICQINHFIVFLVTNTCENPPLQKGGRYISTKDGHTGYGLLNVRTTVEQQYGGTLSTDYKDNLFTVQVTFSGRAFRL